MTEYRVEPASCRAIFSSVEEKAGSAAKRHSAISAEVDELRDLCAKGEAARIASALSAVYNRVLTVGMTSAVQQMRNAATGGRSAVSHIQAGDQAMADNTERAAHDVDDIEITDGKPL